MSRPFGVGLVAVGAMLTGWSGGAAAQPHGPHEGRPVHTMVDECEDADLARYVDEGGDGELSEVCRERLHRLRDAMNKEDDDEKRKTLPEWRQYSLDSIEAYSFGVFGAGMAARFDDFGLGTMPGIDMPDILKERNARLHGLGWLAGGGARATYQSDGGFRIGMTVGAYKLDGMELLHDELQPGASVALKRGSMLGFQLNLGKAFDARVVYPYIDALFLFNVVNASVDVSIADYGYVGTTQLSAFSFGLAPRAGVFVPIDGDFYFDFSAHYGLFGVERGGGQIMFGIWDD